MLVSTKIMTLCTAASPSVTVKLFSLPGISKLHILERQCKMQFLKFTNQYILAPERMLNRQRENNYQLDASFTRKQMGTESGHCSCPVPITGGNKKAKSVGQSVGQYSAPRPVRGQYLAIRCVFVAQLQQSLRRISRTNRGEALVPDQASAYFLTKIITKSVFWISRVLTT